MLSMRYHLANIDKRRASIGAPPTIVELGAPGSRDEVRAYAERIEHAWQEFWDADVKPWAKSDWTPTPGGTVVGDVLGGTPEQQAKAKADIALFNKMIADRKAFEAYRDSISGFNPFGPTPSQAWQKLILFETDLKDDRSALKTSNGGKALVSRDPGELELPGGVDQGTDKSIGTLLTFLKWGVIGVGLYYGGKIALDVVESRKASSASRALPAHEPKAEHVSHETPAEGTV